MSGEGYKTVAVDLWTALVGGQSQRNYDYVLTMKRAMSAQLDMVVVEPGLPALPRDGHDLEC